MTQLRLILGDQLNPHHSWFSQIQTDVVYVMLELQQETRYVRHHAQKVLAVFAAMRAFASQLRRDGHRVRYVSLGDLSNRGGLTDNLDALIRHYQATSFAWQLPDEWRLDEQLRQWATGLAITTFRDDTEHFYTDRGEAAAFFAGKSQWRMELFYRAMRKRHGVLLDEHGQPTGGQWNFDHDNRASWPGTPAIPVDNRPHHDHVQLWVMLQDEGVPVFGEPCADDMRWPVCREEALLMLADFVEQVLPFFGLYQDAMHTVSFRLFHSLLSFALNTKMLSPREVVSAAEQAWSHGKAPLASVEGFIRQILGWREYVRGIYWARMPAYREMNMLEHNRPLPEWFWTGHTRMRCLSESIGQSLREAYAHHIQRLMVIGNFALLAGLSPQALHEWYLGIYIDAFEWVELPNTLGMSQFADGGFLASKPYVSSAAYIRRMSNYCDGCRYRHKDRLGEQACPFNALYWDFFMRHRHQLGKLPRLAMVYRQLDRMSVVDQQAISDQSRGILMRLDDV